MEFLHAASDGHPAWFAVVFAAQVTSQSGQLSKELMHYYNTAGRGTARTGHGHPIEFVRSHVMIAHGQLQRLNSDDTDGAGSRFPFRWEAPAWDRAAHSEHLLMDWMENLSLLVADVDARSRDFR